MSQIIAGLVLKYVSTFLSLILPVVKTLEGRPELDPAGPDCHPAQAGTVPVDGPVGRDQPRGRVGVGRGVDDGVRVLRLGVLRGEEDDPVLALLLAVRHGRSRLWWVV